MTDCVPRRITLIISSLAAGGAERVVATQGNYWAAKGWNVTIITCAPPPQQSFYRLHPGLNHINVDFGSASKGIFDWIQKNFKRNFALRRAIIDSRPDCVISHLHIVNIRTIIASIGLQTPVIVTEHIQPSLVDIGPLLNMLRSLTYSWAGALTAPNRKIVECFPERIKKKAIEIANPVNVENIEGAFPITRLSGLRNIAAMGRLEKQKRFDLLLAAFAKILPDADCFLNIVGEGPLRDELGRLAVQLGIAERVRFWGVIKTPWALLKQANMFVLSSEFEGLPMVLLEAMACGLPLISFDCPVGPREIIRDGIDGVLVPPLDVDALAKAMERLLNDDEERFRLGYEAAKSVERFSVERVMKQWEDLIEQVIQSERHK